MRRFSRAIAFYCALLPAFTDISAQQTIFNFFPLDKQHGLSDDRVNAITADKDGFMWFATSNGLNRYNGYEFKKYFSGDSNPDLPESFISNLYSAKNGDLWIILNRKGFCRYVPENDSFIHYSLNPDGNFPANDFPKGFTEDSDSVLYVATSGGLFARIPGSKEFIKIPDAGTDNKDSNRNTQALLSPLISAITPDENGGIWIAYEDWRISFFDIRNNKYRHFDLGQFGKGLIQRGINSLLHQDGKLWIGSLGPGLICFDPEAQKIETFLESETLVTITKMVLSEDSILWLSTGGGLVQFNLKSHWFRRYTSIEGDNSGLSTTPVSSFYDDHTRGIIWVGTINAGVNYAFRNIPFEHLYTSPDQYFTVSEKDVSAITIDSEGNLWIGYVSGSMEFHSHLKQKKTSIAIQSLQGNYSPGSVFCIFEDSRGDIYCGSWTGGIQKFDRRKERFLPLEGSPASYSKVFEGSDVRDIEEDEHGNLYFAMHGKGVIVYNPEKGIVKRITGKENDPSGITNDWVYDMEADLNGHVWVGSAWGLTRISTSDFTMKQFFSLEEDSLSITHNSIPLIYIDRNENTWIAGQYGLSLYNPEKENFYRISFPTGRNDVEIKSMEMDQTDTYWCGTPDGILKFRVETGENGIPAIIDYAAFHIEDGLNSDYFNLKCSTSDSEGKLFFGGKNGLDLFNPLNINPLQITPALKLCNFEIFGKKVYPGTSGGPGKSQSGEVQLKSGQNMLGFEFVALNYFNAKDNQYSYRLEPLNEDWVNTGNQRKIVFSNLDYGHYSLSLKVVTGYGPEEISENVVSFYIRPPFWHTRWFLFTVVILLTGSVFFAFRMYTTNLRLKQQRLEKLVAIRTSELNEKNSQLEENSLNLKKINQLLQERQKKIQDQSDELKLKSESLTESNKKLQELNSTKDTFFSILAHDLKNPFSSILGFTELMKDDYDKHSHIKRKELINYVHASVRQIYSLLENLLGWSRSQANILSIKKETIHVKELAENNFKLMKAGLEGKELNFTMNIQEGTLIYADLELLNTVLRNIIGNSVKFTPRKGNIEFHARIINPYHSEIKISDNGQGMDQDELEALFRIEKRSSRKGTEGESGTGLGMILCKEFIEKMDGNIRVESEKGKGTSVFLVLPSQESVQKG